MAAPVPTARVTPTGRKIGTGGPTYIIFASKPGLNIWENSVKPLSFQLDDRKDNSSFQNDRVRTFSPGRLMTGQDVVVQAGYDPDETEELWDLIGVRDTITIQLPTGTRYAFYGWLDQLDFSELNEDDDPTVTLTIAQGNQDWDTCVEEMPTMDPGNGTSPIC